MRRSSAETREFPGQVISRCRGRNVSCWGLLERLPSAQQQRLQTQAPAAHLLLHCWAGSSSRKCQCQPAPATIIEVLQFTVRKSASAVDCQCHKDWMGMGCLPLSAYVLGSSSDLCCSWTSLSSPFAPPAVLRRRACSSCWSWWSHLPHFGQ